MHSSQRSFQYPPEQNLFNEYFKLLAYINGAVNAAVLKAIFPKITHYETQHREMGIQFNPDTLGIHSSPPTSDQISLYSADGAMLRMLRVMCGLKLKSFGESINEAAFEKDVALMRYQLNTEISVTHPIAHAIHLFTTIAIEVLILDDCSKEYTNTDAEDFISIAMTILDCIVKYKQTFSELRNCRVNNIDNVFAEELQCLIYVLIYDTEPKNKSQSYAAFIADVFVKKLMRLHLQLEARMKKLASKSVRSVEYFQTCQLMTETDSVMRRLNMQKSPEQREQFDKQARRFTRGNHSFDIMLWCNNTVADDLYTYLDNTIRNLYTRMDYIQILDCYLLTLKAGRFKYDTNYDLTLMHHLEVMLFKVRLVKQHSYELSADKLETESPTEYMTRINRYQQLKAAYSLLISTLGGMQYMMQASRGIIPTINQWSFTILDNIKSMQHDIIDFKDVESELANVNLGMLFEINTFLRLNGETSTLSREDFVSQIAVAIIDLFVKIDHDQGCFNPYQKVFSSQFVLDFYYTSLLQCQTNAESKILINEQLHSLIIERMQGLQNYPAYALIDFIIMRIKRLGMKFDEIDDNYYDSFDNNEKIELLNKCKDFVSMIGININRINTTLRVFAIHHIAIFLGYLSKSENKKERGVAARLMEPMNDFYKVVHKFTNACFQENMELKLLYEPVRFDHSKASFLPANEPATHAKPPGKTSHKPSAPAAVPTTPKKPEFNIFLSYEENLNRLDGNYDLLLQEYEKAPLTGKKRDQNIKTLMGLAQHLQHMQNAAARKVILKKLDQNHARIFEDSRSFMHVDDIDALEKRYQEFIKPWIEAPKLPSQRAITTVAPIVPTVQTTAPPKLKSQGLKQKKTSFFHDPENLRLMSNATILRAKKPEPAVWTPLVANPDPFHEMRKPHPVAIVLSKLQESIFDELEKSSFYPIIQGGAVQDALFGVPYRDIDFLCFCSKDMIEKFILQHKEKFHISGYRKNKSSPVFVIQFDTRFVDVNDEELEIAYLPVRAKEDISEVIRKFTRGFGVKTVFADKRSLIDPLNQFLRGNADVPTLNVEDVLSTDISVDLTAYFKQYPERIFDCLYKITKYKKQGYHIPIKAAIQESMNAAREEFTTYLNNRLSIAKFNKLFMRGFATEAFDVFCAQSPEFILNLLPQLSLCQLALFRQACVLTDARMQDKQFIPLTTVKRESLRAQFISDALFFEFIHQHSVDDLVTDKKSFDITCVKFISLCRFYVSDELINHLQELWWPQIQMIHQEKIQAESVTSFHI